MAKPVGPSPEELRTSIARVAERPKGGESDPKKSLDWYRKARNGRKRDYIFSVSKMKVCPHNRLHALAVGGNWYRCEDCNWGFNIVTTYAQPLHNIVVGGLLNALHFAKEFGNDALQEVARTPKGQHETDFHMPALPEGMSFFEAAALLDTIDVNTADMGKTQLRDLLEKHWVPDAEVKRRVKELQGAGLLKGLGAPDDSEPKSLGVGASAEGQDSPERANMPRLPRRKKPSPKSRHPLPA